MNGRFAVRSILARPWLYIAVFLSFWLAGCSLGTSTSTAKPLTREEKWHRDLDYLAAELPRRHADAYHTVSKEDFAKAISQLNEAIPTLTDAEIMVEMARIAASIGDGHTALSLDQRAVGFHAYPLRLQWFADGLYVTGAGAQYRQALGARLLKIGDAEVDAALRTIAQVISRDNEEQLLSISPTLLVKAEVLAALKILPDTGPAAFTLSGADGKALTLELTAVAAKDKVEWVYAPDPTVVPTPLYLRKPQDYYWYAYLPEQQAIYCQYNVCGDRKDLLFRDFVKELTARTESFPVAKFILDLRLNGGGDSRVAAPLLKALRTNPDLNRRGRLFVLVGRLTYSSALLNALEFKEKTKAILAGQPTGGRPRHYGEVQALALPNSALQVTCATKYFGQAREDTASLVPEISLPLAAADYFAGNDPVLAKVLAY